jgi:thiol-disulfide isomerase/thioredoxin
LQIRNAWWEHKLLAGKTRSEDACRKLVDAARERIVQGRANADLAEVRSAYDGLVALHDREVEWDIEAAADRQKLYEKPPVDWETTNLAGEPRRRADYQGKIVILDFWYRGCGHCILALPKLKALHSKYKERGVVVLGVNNDSDLEDAHHVVNSFAIPYESVRNVMALSSTSEAEASDEKAGSNQAERRISTEYSVDLWPTFVVLDQSGRVAEVVGGNAEDLVEHLSQAVESLLAAPPGE